MKDIWVSMTEEGTRRYPMHSHDRFEIMYYLWGEGFMQTEEGDLPFRKGTVVVVPPRMMHGSASENGFVNISVGGDFSHLFRDNTPLVLSDNDAHEGEMLARLIYANRLGNESYLSALCGAYVHFLLGSAGYESEVARCVADLKRQIDDRFAEPDLHVSELLRESGYAEDYIRLKFREVTSLTPTQFLTHVRIERAKSLFEIYGKSRSVEDVALACGFEDAAYFSRCFSRLTGVSPRSFRDKNT